MSRIIEHLEEFPLAADTEVVSPRELAGAYARTFRSPDGQRVLDDLLKKFHPDRPRFFGHSDAIRAAHIDGQCDVLREIRQAMAAGKHSTDLATQ